MVLTALSVSTLFTFLLLPLAVLAGFSVVLIPCLLSPGVKVSAAVKALYCYIFQAVGIAMMTAGALPAVYGVVEKFSIGVERFSAEMYLSLLILFSVGGVTYLWHEQIAERIDDTSRRIPALLFWYSFKAIGYLIVLIAALSFVFTMLMTRPLEIGWWITPVVTFFYGVLLSWCTRFPSNAQFKMMPMSNGMKVAAAGKRKK